MMDPYVGPHSSAALSHGRAPWLVLGLWVPRVWRRVSDNGVRARFHSQPPTPALHPFLGPPPSTAVLRGTVDGVVWCREAEGAPGLGCVGVLFGFHSLFATAPVPLGGPTLDRAGRGGFLPGGLAFTRKGFAFPVAF